MRNLYYLLLAAVLGLSMSLYGCPPTADDDDSTPPADDDDVTDDDDDDDDDNTGFEYEALTFGAQITVIAPDDDDERDDDDSAGDDDDSAMDDDDDSAMDDDDDSSADDDDIAPDDDDSAPPADAYDVSIVFYFSYWADQAAGVLACQQLVQATGEAVFGFNAVEDGTCNNCTGHIVLDPTSFTDISDPLVDPDHCDVAVLDEAGTNYGFAMTAPAPDGGADFVELGTLNAAAMEALGAAADTGGNQTAAQITADLAGGGYAFVQAAAINATAATVSAQSGLDAVANPVGAGQSWYYFWYFYKDPATNPHEGTDMHGEYFAGSFWQFGGSQ